MTLALRVACVGAGYFGQFHYDSWSRMPRVERVGACDRDIEKAEATGLKAYDDLGQMLREQRPDLLDIILPPAGHAAALRTAIEHDVKWIICQKPFCKDLKEARKLVAEADGAGVNIIVHENFRFQPWYRCIGEAINDGLIGQPLQFTYRLRPGDGQGEDAYLDRQPYFREMEKLLIHETGVHYVDTFRFLLGKPKSVYADLRRINPVIKGEDAGYVMMEHIGGCRSVLDGNRNLDHAADNLRRTMGEALVEGTEGTIKLYGDGSVTLRKFGTLKEDVLLGPDAWDGFGGDCVHALQEHVVSGILDDEPIENLAPEYLQIIQIEEAIYASADDGRKIDLGYL